MRTRIDVIDQDVGAIAIEGAIDLSILQQADNGRGIARWNAVVQDVPRHGAIHGARVDVIEPDLLRESACHTAFSGSGRPVDRNNPMSASGRAHSSSSTFAGVSELITGVVARIRLALTNSSRVFSKPGYDSRTHSTS